MLRKISRLLLVLLTVANLTALGFWLYRKYVSSAQASPVEERMKMRGRARNNPGLSMRENPLFKSPAGLSAEDRQKYNTAIIAYRSLADSLFETIFQGRIELMDALRQDNPNREKIDSLLRQIGRNQFLLEERMIKHLSILKSYLNVREKEHLFDALSTRLKIRHRRRLQMQEKKPFPRM